MNIFLPDIYQKSIYTIDYKKLKSSGIKCLIFDLNNTIATKSEFVPNSKAIDLIETLKDMNFKIVLMSNDSMKRVTPFKNKLNIDSSCSARKPFKNKYKKIQALFSFEAHEIACIGDALVTDVFGANKMGFTSILINPLSSNEKFLARMSRAFERIIYKNFKKRGLLKRGVYYD